MAEDTHKTHPGEVNRNSRTSKSSGKDASETFYEGYLGLMTWGVGKDGTSKMLLRQMATRRQRALAVALSKKQYLCLFLPKMFFAIEPLQEILSVFIVFLHSYPESFFLQYVCAKKMCMCTQWLNHV